MSNALWLSDQLYGLLRELNILIYSGTKGNAGLIDFGKTNYVTIAELRTNIERVFARDMLVLHDVPAFLKGKKPSDSYTPLARRG
jgi:hypothetical protein